MKLHWCWSGGRSAIVLLFIKSERNPEEDPLVLWLTQSNSTGPLAMKLDVYNGTLPSLVSTTYSWTKVTTNYINGHRSLIFSGDHYMTVPYLGTQAWIRSLNYSIVDDWRPWMINDEIAGEVDTQQSLNQRKAPSCFKGGSMANLCKIREWPLPIKEKRL
ncbi:hypothetical protein F2Q70_00045363 [Brassica cretica]|uniref:Uncharacterized protein n=1 Tax=Brassica cretica TaxID=69181 RepID=A0A8S9KI00_BRACR|nr:hypothetical protein F2Q70_00045363 [Brassica cretica]